MRSMVVFIKANWIQWIAAIAIASAYLLFAPNYDWSKPADETAYGADFLQEWVGARMIVTGHSSELYQADLFRAWQHDPEIVGFEWRSESYFPPVYPPPHYALFSPFALLPYRWATVIWLLLLIATAFASARLMSDIVQHNSQGAEREELDGVRAKSKYLWIGLLLFPSLLFSLTLGQKSVCWMFLVCATWRLLQRNREFAAGLVFGLLSIKPTLFFLAPLVLLRNGRWRFFAGASAGVCAIWGGAICLFPWHTWYEFAEGLRSVGSYAENGGYRLDWSCNLMTFAYSLPLEMSQWCKWAICLPLALYLLYCVFEDRAFAIESPEKALMLFSSTLLISPHSYSYDLCILLLPILWMIVKTPVQGMAYFAMLSVGIVVSADVQEFLHIPILPLLMVGIVCELRMRGVLRKTMDGALNAPMIRIAATSHAAD